jgi:hypothetical protein
MKENERKTRKNEIKYERNGKNESENVSNKSPWNARLSRA